MKMMMFAKHLQSWPLVQAAEQIRELGFAGIDLTVRPTGYISPARVRQDLPDAIKTIADQGLCVPLITTDLRSADADAVATFEAAAKLGIGEIKLGYHKYGEFGTFHRVISEAQHDLDTLEKLASATGVRANLHVHSGPHLTAQAAVVWELIKNRNPKSIGAYIDPGHMCVEGGRDGWRQGLDLLHERVTLVAIKDFAWDQVPDPELGKARMQCRVVPLRAGMVPWPRVFACLQAIGFDGWVSLHGEYAGRSAAEVIDLTRDDLAYLRGVLEAAGAHAVAKNVGNSLDPALACQ